jgi:hypothetical protein
MTRAQLEHVIRASAAIAGVNDIVVIGSQAVLGEFPNAPEELLISQEADVFPMDHPEKGDLIDGSIGEGSPFQRSFGYYAHGVDDSTAVLPRGWRDRLVPVTGTNTRDATGWCLEVHDLAIAKYIAGREKDLIYTRALAQHGMTKRDILMKRLADTGIARDLRVLTEARIEANFGANPSPDGQR